VKRRGRPKLADELAQSSAVGHPLNVGGIVALLMEGYGRTFEDALAYVREHSVRRPSRNTAAKYYRLWRSSVGKRADAIARDPKAITAAEVARARAAWSEGGSRKIDYDAPRVRRLIAMTRAKQEFAEAETARIEAARAARHRTSITYTVLSPQPWTVERVREELHRIADNEAARLAKHDPNPPTLRVTIAYRPATKKSRRR
jgi:hypothetical protein